MSPSFKLFGSFIVFSIAILLTSCGDDSIGPPVQNSVPGTILTVAGQGPSNFNHTGDGGSAVNATLGWVVDVFVDDNDNLYVVDGAANTVRLVNQRDGIITTVAGTFLGYNVNGEAYTGDGGVATEARLNVCLKVAVDAANNLMITDNGNNVIRRVDGSSGIITTAIGSHPGIPGFSGDNGPATEAQLFNPQGIVFDSEGNMFLTDTQNHVIRRVSKDTGIISTIAGIGPENAGLSGDGGPAIEAELNSPTGLAIDKEDNLYFSDRENHVIRKISDGIISTIAGNGLQGNDGDGGPALAARILGVNGVAVDQERNVFITSGNSIRMIDQNTGTISTVAGNGTEGFSGDGGPATEAELSSPWGVAVDSNGNIYIADSGNAAVRMVVR